MSAGEKSFTAIAIVKLLRRRGLARRVVAIIIHWAFVPIAMALAIAEAVSSMQRAHAPTNRGRKRRTVSEFRVGVVDPIIAARPAADTFIRINYLSAVARG